MDTHKNAPLTPKGREMMVRAVIGGLSKPAVARRFTITPKTVAKWVNVSAPREFDGLHDRSSRPRSLPSQTAPATAAAVEALQRCTGQQIAAEVLMDTGARRERAVLYWLLSDIWVLRGTAAKNLLQANAGMESWRKRSMRRGPTSTSRAVLSRPSSSASRRRWSPIRSLPPILTRNWNSSQGFDADLRRTETHAGAVALVEHPVRKLAGEVPPLIRVDASQILAAPVPRHLQCPVEQRMPTVRNPRLAKTICRMSVVGRACR
jgi:hypothetical protein